MKKFLVTSVITALICGAAFAQTTNIVSSANVVGYNSVTIPSNQYVLVALAFSNSNPTVSNLFAALPSGASVTFWDPTTQQYVPVTKTRSGWGALGSNVLAIGSGVFVKNVAAPATNIYFSGDALMANTTTLNVSSGAYKLVSFPYSSDAKFTNTTLGGSASVSGDSISVWSNNNWTVITKTRAGWGSATNLTLQTGQSMFYKSAANRTVIENRPYTNSWN